MDRGETTAAEDAQRRHVWSKVLNGRDDVQGDYFPVKALARLFVSCDADALKALELLELNPFNKRPESVIKLMGLKSREKIPELVNSIINTIEAKGASRVAYAGDGAFSLFLRSTPNVAGRQQLIGLSHVSERYIDCPLILPAIESSIITQGKYKLRLRVMPELKTGADVTDQDVETIARLMDKITGGDNNFQSCIDYELSEELGRKNIGVLEFTNSKNEHKRVPLLFDWGVVHFMEDSDIREQYPLKEMQENWKKDPELADWYEAQAYLRRQHEMVNTPVVRKNSVAELRRAGFESNNPLDYASALEAAEEYGLYADEIAKFASDAQHSTGKTFVERLNDSIKQADLSQFHKR